MKHNPVLSGIDDFVAGIVSSNALSHNALKLRQQLVIDFLHTSARVLRGVKDSATYFPCEEVEIGAFYLNF